MAGNTTQELQMTRLSKLLEDQLGVRLQHSDLKKLGYKMEKRPNNPNTYYKVPGLTSTIENCPKVVKYIRQVFLQNKKQELEKLLGKVRQQQKTLGEAAKLKGEQPVSSGWRQLWVLQLSRDSLCYCCCSSRWCPTKLHKLAAATSGVVTLCLLAAKPMSDTSCCS
jgi:hypothetical protein